MMLVTISAIVFLAVSVKSDVPVQEQPLSQSSQQTPQPVYKASNPPNYVPHSTYPYSESYGSGLDGFFVPALQYTLGTSSNEDSEPNALTPTYSFLQTSLRVFSKVGLFLVGGIVLLLVGAAFHTMFCALSQVCTVHYHGFGGIDRNAVKDLVTPERVARAAAFFQDAMDKYHKLQGDSRK